MLHEELTQAVDVLRAIGSDVEDLEVKSAAGGLPKSLRETLSAFSNTGGGTVILGLREDEGFKPSGLSDPAKLAADLASMCASDIEPAVRAAITQIHFEDAWVVVAEVPPVDPQSSPAFVKAKGANAGSYIRVHDGDQQLSTYEVQMVIANRGQPLDDLDPVPSTSVKDLHEGLTKAYVDRVRTNRPYAFVDLDQHGVLTRSRVLVTDEQGVERLSLAGLLALGSYPQQFYPQLALTLVRYPTERGPDTDSGIRFLDNVTLEGPIPIMARDALNAIRRNMQRRSTVQGVGRTDVWEYPEASLREAVVNALVHRDLSAASRGTQAQIEMYPDRLLVKNPGGLFGPVSVAHITDEGTSSSRNSFLLKLLEDVVLLEDDRAVCENRGSGIRTMVDALRKAGMSIPRFDNKISSFAVTFPNHALLSDNIVAWIASLGEVGLTDSQVVGLATLKSGAQLDNSSYRAATGVDSRLATSELQDLVSREIVTQVGSRRWTAYQLAPRVRQIGDTDARRPTPRDRRAVILEALVEGPLSRAQIEARTGLGKQVVIRWLRTLRAEGDIALADETSLQSKNVTYRRTGQSSGELPFDFEAY